MKSSVQNDTKRTGVANSDTAAFTFPTFDKAAVVLAQHGYDPLPVETRKKHPVLDLARRMGIASWEHYRFEAAHADRFRQKGIGILTARTPAVDMDVRDPDIVAEIDAMVVEVLGAAPARVGQSPKLLRVYRLDGAPFAKKQTKGYRLPGDNPEDKAHRVEVLADKQQFVAFNLHPVTKMAYRWNGSGSPLTVAASDLPPITEAQAEEIIRRADAIIARRGTPVGKLVEADESREHAPNEKQKADDPALLKHALAAIPNEDLEYDDWVVVMMAVKGALGENGLQDFLAWSAKSGKDRPEFSSHEFLAAKPKSIGAGTVYFLAAEHGWKRPAPKSGAEAPWPKPGNILRDRVAPPFEAADLPAVLSEYPMLYARYTGFDPGLALVTALAVGGAALDDRIMVSADRATGWRQSARLWVLSVLSSGEGKDPTQKQMIVPLQRIHDREQREYKEKLAAWKITSAEQAKRREPVDDPPPQPAVLVTDTTIEALSDDLAEHERGLCIWTDEFHTWLGGFDQYHGGGSKVSAERGHWMAAFEGGSRTIKRVKRGNVYVANWGVSIITATTPAALREMAAALRPTDGLLQRFIAIMARHQEDVRPEDRPTEAEMAAAWERYTNLIETLWRMEPPNSADRETGDEGAVELSVPAKKLFERWRSQNKVQKRAFENTDGALAAHLAKHPNILLRAALVFHAAEAARRGKTHLTGPISTDTLQQAIRFMHRVAEHAHVAYRNREGGGQGFGLACELARYLLTRGADRNAKGIERSELTQRVNQFRDAKDEVLREAALDLLIDFGWLRVNDGVGEGKARKYNKSGPTRWHVNPRLEDTFAEQAELEREQRMQRLALLRGRVGDETA